jgi:hypothetical protein
LTTCSKCNASRVPDSRPDCPACGHYNGPPNVRMAQKPEELAALETRFNNAVKACSTRGVFDKLEAFGAAVSTSKAVIARPFSEVLSLVEDEGISYTSFARQVQSGRRNPLDQGHDPIRNQFENAVFPNYYHSILFASLSMTGKGLSGYGGCTMVLKDHMIHDRATVFEENPAILGNESKLNLGLNDRFPPGYRATWHDRPKLAMAKLHSSIEPDTNEDDFDSLLQSDNGKTDNSNCIEVHIYGSINVHSIEWLSTTKNLQRKDDLVWRALQIRAKELGIKAERA